MSGSSCLKGINEVQILVFVQSVLPVISSVKLLFYQSLKLAFCVVHFFELLGERPHLDNDSFSFYKIFRSL